MKNRLAILLGTALAVFLLDQLTKFILVISLPKGGITVVINGIFNIVHVRNKGAAFGLFSGLSDSVRDPFFFVISSLSVILIIALMWKTRREGLAFGISLALILGGAIGNLTDRFRLGEVVDFIQVHWNRYYWPSFNVADSAITIGVGLMILKILFSKSKEDQHETNPI